MCQNNYNRKKEEKKYKHLNYVEKTQIESITINCQ